MVTVKMLRAGLIDLLPLHAIVSRFCRLKNPPSVVSTNKRRDLRCLGKCPRRTLRMKTARKQGARFPNEAVLCGNLISTLVQVCG